MKDFFTDDKNMVIVAVLVLGLAMIFKGSITPEVAKAMPMVFSGLFGIAVGKAIK